MIKVYWRPNGEVVEGKIDSLRSKKTAWLDCFNPTKPELTELSKLTGIDVADFKEHLEGYERPTTIEDEKYSLIVFGCPVLKKQSAETSSLAIFVTKNNNVVTIRKRELESLDKFRQEILDKNPRYIRDSPTRIVQAIMEKVIDTYFAHIDLFQEAADKIEAVVFKNPQKRAVEETFNIRKSMLLFHKALIANREVLLSIEKLHLSRLSKKDAAGFRDIRDDVMQLIDAADTMRNVLTGVLDIYTSSVSNQMNQVIKKLTVVASYVLIPTLIASIYGMNFKYMPEIPWKWGYPFSLGLMVVSILLAYYYFKKSKMI